LTTDTGVVVRTPRTAILDTRSLGWELVPDLPAAREQILSRGRGRLPAVSVLWLPESSTVQELPGDVFGPGPAWILVLAGDLAIRPRGKGVATVIRTGHWVDAAGAGVEIDRPYRSQGSLGALVVRDRFPSTATLDAAVRLSPDVVVVDTLAMPWSRHFGMEIGRTKVLATQDDGTPLAYLTRTPAGSTATEVGKAPARHYHRTVSERIFVLGGRLVLREWANMEDQSGTRVLVREGYFIDREPGSIHAVEERSPVGFASLEIRSGVGNYPNDPNYVAENYIE